MASKSQIAANVKYNKSMDAITIRPDKHKGQLIRAAAEAAGQPLQRYIIQAVDERMERDRAAGQTQHAPPDDPGDGG